MEIWFHAKLWRLTTPPSDVRISSFFVVVAANVAVFFMPNAHNRIKISKREEEKKKLARNIPHHIRCVNMLQAIVGIWIRIGRVPWFVEETHVFEQMIYCVHPESGHTFAQPKCENIPHFGNNMWISEIQIRLAGHKLMQIILLTLCTPLPCRTAEHRDLSPQFSPINSISCSYMWPPYNWNDSYFFVIITQLFGGIRLPCMSFFPSFHT